MATDTQDLSKVDSAISGLSSSPTEGKHVPAKKRTSSSATGVMNINDLGRSLTAMLSSVVFLIIYQLYPKEIIAHRTYLSLTYHVEKDGVELQIAKETQRLNW